MRKQPSSEYRGYRTAGIRLTEALIPYASSIRSTVRDDVYYAVHAFDKAHVVMLAEEGIIPRADAVAMLQAYRRMEAAGVPETRGKVGGGQHSGEQYLIRELGEEFGGNAHIGRSSGDLGIVTNRTRQRDRLLDVLEHLGALRRVVVRRAEEEIETVMPAYWHNRQARLTTVGAVLLDWASTLERDAFRLRRAYARTNVSAAGTTVGTGTSFPLNRERTRELLGFDDLDQNALDAHERYAVLFETFTALTILHANLSRWSDDLMMWSTNESEMVDFADRYCGTSSIMMQKKNPYTTELVKGGAADVVGGLVSAFLIDKGPSSFAILDRRFAEATLWRVFDNTVNHLRAFAGLLDTLTCRRDRVQQVIAPRIAAAETRDARTASVYRGIRADELRASARAIQRAIEEDEAWVTDARARIAAAAQALEAAVDAILAG